MDRSARMALKESFVSPYFSGQMVELMADQMIRESDREEMYETARAVGKGILPPAQLQHVMEAREWCRHHGIVICFACGALVFETHTCLSPVVVP